MSILSNYNKLNKSFNKKLVFHLGVDAGFFSEYNNMILAMLFCLKNKISFTLYSSTANFGIENGWTDYFLPFCEEDKNKNHKRFNYRMPLSETNPNRKNQYIFTAKLFSLINISFDSVCDQVTRLIYFRKSQHFDFFTYNLWYKIRTVEKGYIYEIPELAISGDLQEAASKLVQMTWRFNQKTLQKITSLIDSLNIDSNYIGFHIRAGDKSKEHTLLDPFIYLKKAESLTDIRIAFILTDDYKIIEDMCLQFSNWKFYTLCNKDERGYSHKTFQQKSKEYKDKNLLKLFASMELLNSSKLFIGTYSSNPGMFMGMRREKNKCIGMDFTSWYIV